MNSKKIMLYFLFISFMLPVAAYCADGSIPELEYIFNNISGFISGPLLRFAAVTAVIVGALGIISDPNNGIFRQLFRIILGIGIAASAASIVSNIFGL